ncbi:DUF2812 domain-containing protein [Bacillus sp. FJAT-42376]|uniref:DUF2812 domain-containing protein n=1 Tax=Bacillus sp. FJAT-42376 TaxID=2014076 RepID=UPI000F4FCD42|nr:DUF2812 domain-containing protein [Bacillus sp. FJAT-42376]AZB40922.1 DUF2812 domain-containing protein [Bacillus sp. FJAT-42376]
MMKKVFKLYFAWADDAEAKWLTSMSKKGWGLKSYKWGLYTFEKITPANYIYRLDYQASLKDDREEYYSIFHEAGWEHAAEFNGWQYFRRPAEDHAETPDIYSDLPSKVQKYHSLSLLIFLLTLPALGIFLSIILPSDYGSVNAVKWIFPLCLAFNLIAIGCLQLKRRSLMKNPLS